jgi:HK97 family phage portal protein
MGLKKDFINWVAKEVYKARDPMRYVGNTEDEYSIPSPEVYGNQSDLYRRLAWVQIAVKTVAETAASQRPEVYKKLGEKKESVDNHDFEILMQSPNELQTGFEFLTMLYSFYKLTGNAYLWINGGEKSTPLEMIPIIPKDIRPVPGKNLGTLRGYVYTDMTGRDIPFEPWEICHIKTFNPKSVYIGLSPIESIYVDATTDLEMQKVKNKQYGKDGGRVPDYLLFKDPINDTDWEKLKKDHKKNSADSRTMLLRGVGDGVSYVQGVLSNKDMQELESRKFTQNEIFNLFAPGLVSVLSENATEANAKSGENTLAGKAIYPMLRAFGERITKDIMPRYGKEYVLEFEDPRIPDTQIELLEIAEYAKTHSIDEVRQKYYGDSPLLEYGGMLLAQITPQAPVYDTTTTDTQLPDPAKKKDTGLIDDLGKWRRKAVKRAEKGQSILCDFESEHIPVGVADMIKSALKVADCTGCINDLFNDIEQFVQKGDIPERSKKFTPNGANRAYAGDDSPLDQEDIDEAVKTWDKLMPEYKGLLDAKIEVK